ncbi:hypothetical protein MMPV_000694 [Pyropia vietnamensis]
MTTTPATKIVQSHQRTGGAEAGHVVDATAEAVTAAATLPPVQVHPLIVNDGDGASADATAITVVTVPADRMAAAVATEAELATTEVAPTRLRSGSVSVTSAHDTAVETSRKHVAPQLALCPLSVGANDDDKTATTTDAVIDTRETTTAPATTAARHSEAVAAAALLEKAATKVGTPGQYCGTAVLDDATDAGSVMTTTASRSRLARPQSIEVIGGSGGDDADAIGVIAGVAAPSSSTTAESRAISRLKDPLPPPSTVLGSSSGEHGAATSTGGVTDGTPAVDAAAALRARARLCTISVRCADSEDSDSYGHEIGGGSGASDDSDGSDGSGGKSGSCDRGGGGGGGDGGGGGGSDDSDWCNAAEAGGVTAAKPVLPRRERPLSAGGDTAATSLNAVATAAYPATLSTTGRTTAAAARARVPSALQELSPRAAATCGVESGVSKVAAPANAGVAQGADAVVTVAAPLADPGRFVYGVGDGSSGSRADIGGPNRGVTTTVMAAALPRGARQLSEGESGDGSNGDDAAIASASVTTVTTRAAVLSMETTAKDAVSMPPKPLRQATAATEGVSDKAKANMCSSTDNGQAAEAVATTAFPQYLERGYPLAEQCSNESYGGDNGGGGGHGDSGGGCSGRSVVRGRGEHKAAVVRLRAAFLPDVHAARGTAAEPTWPVDTARASTAAVLPGDSGSDRLVLGGSAVPALADTAAKNVAVAGGVSAESSSSSRGVGDDKHGIVRGGSSVVGGDGGIGGVLALQPPTVVCSGAPASTDAVTETAEPSVVAAAPVAAALCSVTGSDQLLVGSSTPPARAHTWEPTAILADDAAVKVGGNVGGDGDRPVPVRHCGGRDVADSGGGDSSIMNSRIVVYNSGGRGGEEIPPSAATHALDDMGKAAVASTENPMVATGLSSSSHDGSHVGRAQEDVLATAPVLASSTAAGVYGECNDALAGASGAGASADRPLSSLSKTSKGGNAPVATMITVSAAAMETPRHERARSEHDRRAAASVTTTTAAADSTATAAATPTDNGPHRCVPGTYVGSGDKDDVAAAVKTAAGTAAAEQRIDANRATAIADGVADDAVLPRLLPPSGNEGDAPSPSAAASTTVALAGDKTLAPPVAQMPATEDGRGKADDAAASASIAAGNGALADVAAAAPSADAARGLTGGDSGSGCGNGMAGWVSHFPAVTKATVLPDETPREGDVGAATTTTATGDPSDTVEVTCTRTLMRMSGKALLRVLATADGSDPTANANTKAAASRAMASADAAERLALRLSRDVHVTTTTTGVPTVAVAAGTPKASTRSGDARFCQEAKGLVVCGGDSARRANQKTAAADAALSLEATTRLECVVDLTIAAVDAPHTAQASASTTADEQELRRLVSGCDSGAPAAHADNMAPIAATATAAGAVAECAATPARASPSPRPLRGSGVGTTPHGNGQGEFGNGGCVGERDGDGGGGGGGNGDGGGGGSGVVDRGRIAGDDRDRLATSATTAAAAPRVPSVSVAPPYPLSPPLRDTAAGVFPTAAAGEEVAVAAAVEAAAAMGSAAVSSGGGAPSNSGNCGGHRGGRRRGEQGWRCGGRPPPPMATRRLAEAATVGGHLGGGGRRWGLSVGGGGGLSGEERGGRGSWRCWGI